MENKKLKVNNTNVEEDNSEKIEGEKVKNVQFKGIQIQERFKYTVKNESEFKLIDYN